MAPPRHRASFAAWVAKRRPTGLRARHTYDLDRSITNAPTAAGHLSGWDYQHRPGPSPYAASQRFAQDDRRTFSDPTFGGRVAVRRPATAADGDGAYDARAAALRRSRAPYKSPWGVAPEPGCVYVAGPGPGAYAHINTWARRPSAAAATFRSGTRRGPFRAAPGPGGSWGPGGCAPHHQADPAPPGLVEIPWARAITGAAPFRSGTLHTPPFLRPRPPKPRPSTAPALVDAVESEAAGPRAGAPQRSARRVQGDGFARTLTLRPRAHPETRSRLAAVDAAACAAFVRRQRGAS